MLIYRTKTVLRTPGFTLMEILIVTGIMAMLAIIGLVALSSFQKNQGLDADVRNVVATLEEARSNTVSSKGSTSYGVHFEQSQIVLFVGPTYSAGVATNVAYPMSSRVQISGISLLGGGSDVLFKELTGETDQSGTITISVVSGTESRTVTIYGTGAIYSN